MIAKHKYYQQTLVVDYGLDTLYDCLRGYGYKAIRLSRTNFHHIEDVYDFISTWPIVTMRPESYLGGAVKFDFDVIDISNCTSLDLKDRTVLNPTARQVVEAIRRHYIFSTVGNFHVTISNNGSRCDRL